MIWGVNAKDKADPIRIEKAFPAIISKAKSQRVNRLIRSRAPKIAHPRRVGSTYLLSGMVNRRWCCWRHRAAWNCRWWLALAAEAVPVVVVNPRQVRDLARATAKLAKTDSLDAAVLAHFAEVVRPPVRPLRDAETLGPGRSIRPRGGEEDLWAGGGRGSPATLWSITRS